MYDVLRLLPKLFFRILLFYVLSIALIGLNGTKPPLSVELGSSLALSAMGLSQSLFKKHYDFSIHDSVPTSWIKYVHR